MNSALKAQDSNIQIFPFVFSESTGDNQFVLSNGALRPIKLFEPESNKKALIALNSLKANIIYPNGVGNKIYVLGLYNELTASFNLRSWFIITPFVSQDLIDEKEIPQNFKLTNRKKLLKTDFLIPVADPSIYLLDIDKSLSQLMELQKER
jgi:hypothetical protein